MIEIVLWCVAALLALNFVLMLLVLKQMAFSRSKIGVMADQDDLHSFSKELSKSQGEIREDIQKAHQSTTKTMTTNIGEFGKLLTTQSEGMRSAVGMRFQDLQQSTEARLDKIRDAVANQLSSGAKAITDLMHSNETRMEHVRSTVDMRLQAIQTSNEDKFDQMRETVDEKLQSTLEQRLGESFNKVTQRLEEVHRGLGEMQQLATGVDDLKRVLTNVKSRGTWGEVQLGALLEEILAPDQYSTNVQPKPGSHHLVEYAVRLPGNDNEPNSCVWLPIDSTFPLEDYERLIEAAEAADKDEVDKVVATFLAAVERHAKNICDKYIVPPNTTDFAIMFLPTEGLYAEVLRAPGSSAHLLHQHRIVVAGPTTLAAILSSLRLGFRSLAIQKRSSEVWEILAAVKTEFGKFGDVMAKLKQQLYKASRTIDQTQSRTKEMERQLQSVEAIPPDEASVRLGLTNGMPEIHSPENEQPLGNDTLTVEVNNR
jgi:DNA recombination protein RmuC